MEELLVLFKRAIYLNSEGNLEHLLKNQNC